MTRYETLVLFVPEITDSEIAEVETAFRKIVEQAEGKVLSWEKWGKYLLAYPIRHHEYGVYSLSRFELSETTKDSTLKEIDRLFKVKYNTLVMRFMTNVLPEHLGLEYKKPMALDETPKNVNEILKENKMEGLIEKSKEETSAEAK